jgi:hypothetical protein
MGLAKPYKKSQPPEVLALKWLRKVAVHIAALRTAVQMETLSDRLGALGKTLESDKLKLPKNWVELPADAPAKRLRWLLSRIQDAIEIECEVLEGGQFVNRAVWSSQAIDGMRADEWVIGELHRLIQHHQDMQEPLPSDQLTSGPYSEFTLVAALAGIADNLLFLVSPQNKEGN